MEGNFDRGYMREKSDERREGTNKTLKKTRKGEYRLWKQMQRDGRDRERSFTCNRTDREEVKKKH